jgi:alanyl-tRNA synthetase
MTSAEIRQQFLDFSVRGHEIVPSAPLLLRMILPFSYHSMRMNLSFFLGNKQSISRADTKMPEGKWKHNDLEE